VNVLVVYVLCVVRCENMFEYKGTDRNSKEKDEAKICTKNK